MILKDWLELHPGSSTKLAQHLDVKKAQVSQWKTGLIPVKYMKQIRTFTDGAVTLDDMVPDPKPKS